MHQGQKLKHLIQRTGKTNAEVAALSGISEASIYSYYNQEEINSKKLKKLCDALGFDLKVFFKVPNSLEDDQALYGVEYLKREIELLKEQIAAKDEIINLLKSSK